MKPERGDKFTIPLNDDQLLVGQVIQYDDRGLPGYSIGLFDCLARNQTEAKDTQLSFKDCFSVILATPDCFSKSSNWKIAGTQNLVIPKKFFPFEKLRKSKKPGSRLYNREVIEEFVNAYYALLPWDNYFKPDYLDGLLLTPDKKPEKILYGKK